jgi:dihydrofolate reductase
MNKIVVSQFITLDGVIQDPHLWSFDYWNDEIAAFKGAELFAYDALLLGRKTYEGFADAWPERTDDTGYADRINTMPKHVATTTLDTLAWANSHVLKEDVAASVGALKEGGGGDLLVFGSGMFSEFCWRMDWWMSTTCWCTRSCWARGCGCSRRRAALNWNGWRRRRWIRA